MPWLLPFHHCQVFVNLGSFLFLSRSFYCNYNGVQDECMKAWKKIWVSEDHMFKTLLPLRNFLPFLMSLLFVLFYFLLLLLSAKYPMCLWIIFIIHLFVPFFPYRFYFLFNFVYFPLHSHSRLLYLACGVIFWDWLIRKRKKAWQTQRAWLLNSCFRIKKDCIVLLQIGNEEKLTRNIF